MPRSTAKFISYDLRPAKQSERRILLDLLQIAGDCGLPITKYRYIGMGANRFYDFLLIHKYLGINKMTSLEHDSTMYERAKYNCPYSFIDVRNKSTEDFIAENSFTDRNILWLDYDGGISTDATNDIMSLSTKLNVGDFCFVTIGGARPRRLEQKSDQKALEEIKDQFGELAGEVKLEDVEKQLFPSAAHKILLAAFRYAFSTRRDGQFVPFLQVKYADSLTMVTVGGGLMDSKVYAPKFKMSVNHSLPFLKFESNVLYEIKSLHLTERERVLFDRATTHISSGAIEKSQFSKIKSLGFSDEDITVYKELIRYLPRYVETIV